MALCDIFVMGAMSEHDENVAVVEYLSRNRIKAAAQLAIRNPVSAARYILAEVRGRRESAFFHIGDIGLWLRSRSPDLKVVRSCLLGEFNEALDLAGPDPAFIVDAGGYIGLVSILCAKRYPAAEIVCLEPSSENFKIAEKNCRPWSNITVLHCALGAYEGHATLRDRGTGDWGLTIAGADKLELQPLETVEVVTLDGLMRRFGYVTIDLLKLDIEGGEDDLFAVAESWIYKTRVIIAELHERIRPGVTQRYESATRGRREIERAAEKRLSVIK